MLTKEMMEKFISKLQHVMLNRNNSINKAMSSNIVVGRDFLNTFILDDGKNKIYKKFLQSKRTRYVYSVSGCDIFVLYLLYCLYRI